MPKPKLIQGNELFNLYKKKINHEKKVINNLIEKKNLENQSNKTRPIGDKETITDAWKIKINELLK